MKVETEMNRLFNRVLRDHSNEILVSIYDLRQCTMKLVTYCIEQTP